MPQSHYPWKWKSKRSAQQYTTESQTLTSSWHVPICQISYRPEALPMSFPTTLPRHWSKLQTNKNTQAHTQIHKFCQYFSAYLKDEKKGNLLYQTTYKLQQLEDPIAPPCILRSKQMKSKNGSLEIDGEKYGVNSTATKRHSHKSLLPKGLGQE